MKRIDKRVARRLYDRGVTVYATPHKMNPYNIYMKPFEGSSVNGYDFEQLCNQAEYHNCNYETGYYLAYYIKGEEEQ